MSAALWTLDHGLGGHAGEPLNPTAVSALALSAALPPLALGLVLAVRMGSRVGDPLVRGMAGGAMLFLFLDLAQLAANHGMGLNNLALRLRLLAAFALGILGPARWAEHNPAWGWAVGVGLHALGEGIVMGYNLTLSLESALRVLPLLSFVLHKMAEGWTIGLLVQPGQSLAPLAAVAGVPALLGAMLGAWRAPG